jgi:dinuclear metal center YbgI/SA1388 family protein
MKLKVKDIIQLIETYAPPVYQESYDNSGLLVGDKNQEIDSVLISLDVTEDIVEEAVERGAGLILVHHPIVFKGLKRLTPDNYVQRTVISAIKHDIAIFAAHTNLDAVHNGVNFELAQKLGLQNVKVLQPAAGKLLKLYCFVPSDHADTLRRALFDAGAGQIGNYDSCSFNAEGYGTFRAGDDTNPFVGKKGEMHKENEVKLEVIFPVHTKSKLISVLKKVHPYEEPAFDIVALENSWEQLGIGMIGELPEKMEPVAFLDQVKEKLGVPHLKYTDSDKSELRKIAVCGGSGSFLIKTAMYAGADAFLTGDVKYHEFFDAENRMMIVDAGHYETEQFTKELFYRVITKKFPNFAVQISNRNTNPVKYY